MPKKVIIHIINGIEYKDCTDCKIRKELSLFTVRKNVVCGRQSYCKDCGAVRNKNYIEKDREAYLNKRKKYHKIHKLKEKEYGKKYYNKNKEKIIYKNKEWCEVNRKKRNDWYKKSRDNNSEYNKNCKLRNSNHRNLKRALEYYNNGKSDKLPTKSPSRMLLKLYEIQSHNCPYCSNNMKDNIHIDHIIPLSKNGSNEVNNLILCCSSCNLRKSAKELDVWLEECNIDYDEFISNIEKRNEIHFND